MLSVTVKVSFSEAPLPFNFEYRTAETKQKEPEQKLNGKYCKSRALRTGYQCFWRGLVQVSTNPLSQVILGYCDTLKTTGYLSVEM